MEPTPAITRLWLGETPLGFCLQSLVVGPGYVDVIKNVSISDIELHSVDLRRDYRVTVRLVNEQGYPVAATGYCVFEAWTK